MLNNLILFMVLMGLKLRESFIIGRLPCYSEPIKFLYLHESLSRLKYWMYVSCQTFGCLVLLLICIDGSAQITGVVFDMETKRQIAGVRVYINPKGTVITDSRGRFVISQPCNGVTFSHVSYESRAYSRKELCDTIWLMPKLNRLDEVVITAKAPIVCIKRVRCLNMQNSLRPRRACSRSICSSSLILRGISTKRDASVLKRYWRIIDRVNEKGQSRFELCPFHLL